MANEPIGYVTCKHCGYEHAEVKATKKLFQSRPIVMIWCPFPKCLSQHFPRAKEASDLIRSEMRPAVAPPELINAPAANEPAITPQALPVAAAKKPFTFDDFMKG